MTSTTFGNAFASAGEIMAHEMMVSTKPTPSAPANVQPEAKALDSETLPPETKPQLTNENTNSLAHLFGGPRVYFVSLCG